MHIYEVIYKDSCLVARPSGSKGPIRIFLSAISFNLRSTLQIQSRMVDKPTTVSDHYFNDQGEVHQVEMQKKMKAPAELDTQLDRTWAEKKTLRIAPCWPFPPSHGAHRVLPILLPCRPSWAHGGFKVSCFLKHVITSYTCIYV